MKHLTPAFLTCALALGLATPAHAQLDNLTPLTTFGPSSDGTLLPGSFDPYPALDSGNNQRGMAYDPTTGKVVLVNTASGSVGSSTVMGSIYVLDGTYGTNVSTLSTEGINGGSYADASAGIAADGVVYIANIVNNSSNQAFNIYRWPSVDSVDPPTVAFTGNLFPINRYGPAFTVRGAGTNTQILIGSTAYSGTAGTNAVVFTTADGTNFSATVLATDRTSGNLKDGIAFGPGNTFWTKSVTGPLLLMSFDLGTATATTLKSFDSSLMPEAVNLGPLAVDTNANLLAAIEVNSGPERVFLYDISDTSAPPVLMDVKTYTVDAANATAPPGYLAFAPSRLYTYVINNGMYVFGIVPGAITAPVIVAQPGPAIRRALVGQPITYSVGAYPSVSYQWKKDDVDISDATNAIYTIASAVTGDSGTYSVLVTNSAGSLTSSNSVLTVIAPTDLYHLDQLWAVAAGDAPYMNSSGGSSTPNQRTFAYNARSNELYIVSRGGSSSTKFIIYAIPATNFSPGVAPPVIKTLNTNGIGGGTIGLAGIAATDDGAIYACNVDGTGSVTPTWKLYRWANSDSNTEPVLVFSGDPTLYGNAARFGDVMDVRGTGINTQVIIDNQNILAGGSRWISVIAPLDGTLTTWAATPNTLDSYAGNQSIGRSLQWGPDDTIWQKRRDGPLIQTTVYPDNATATTTSNAAYNAFPAKLGVVWVDFTRNVLVGVRTNSGVPHSLELYDVTVPTTPIFIAAYNFPQSPPAGNANFIAQCLISGDYVFALSGNNGVMAFKIVAGPPTAPAFVVQPKNLRLAEGGSDTLTATADQTGTAYQWQEAGANISGATGSSFTISNAQLADAGDYRCIATNTYGSGTSDVATVTVTPLAVLYQLSPIWGSAIASQDYLTFSSDANTPYNRSIAYNSLSNQLYLINRTTSTEGLTISVLDPATGTKLYELNTNGISITTNGTASIILVQMAVADDGAIYAGNACVTSGSGTAEYHLYRWANSDPSTEPVLVYVGDPSNNTNTLRWGDSLAVRGSGMNTEVVVDDGSGTWAAILVPADQNLTTFTNKVFTQKYGAGKIGRSVQFGATNTIWQKRHGLPLKLTSFDTDTGTSTLLASYSEFPSTLGGVALDFTRNLAAGVDFNGTPNAAPDTVALIEISDLNTPLVIARYAFPTNQQGNNNLISQTIFAGNRVFAVDANNGIAGFELVPPQPQLAIQISGASAVLSWPEAFSGYTLEATTDLGNPASWSALGAGTVSGGRYWLTNSIDANARYYRLKK